jgi:hypothetical protein
VDIPGHAIEQVQLWKLNLQLHQDVMQREKKSVEMIMQKTKQMLNIPWISWCGAVQLTSRSA